MVKGMTWHITLLNKQGDFGEPWHQGGIVSKLYYFCPSCLYGWVDLVGSVQSYRRYKSIGLIRYVAWIALHGGHGIKGGRKGGMWPDLVVLTCRVYDDMRISLKVSKATM
jgi:hypothetical protein